MPWQGVGWLYAPFPSSRGTAASLLALTALLLLGALALASAGEASAASNPPASGNWNIDVGEVVSHDNVSLYLYGDLNVRGTLDLDNVSVYIYPSSSDPRVITVHPGGELRGLNSWFVGQDVEAFVFRAGAGSDLDLAGMRVLRAGSRLTDDGSEAGFLIGTDARLVDCTFIECLVGVWASDCRVDLVDCSFIDCQYGAVVSDGGTLYLTGGHIRGCTRGALCNASRMTLTGVRITRCGEGVLAYGGNLTVEDLYLDNCTVLGVGSYGAELTARGCAFRDFDADGIVVHLSRGWIGDCTFDNLTTDVKVVHSEAWISGTSHVDTYDEALWMYHATFHVREVTTRDSYWGLRAFKSTGECRDLTTVNASYGVQLERCTDVTLEGLDIDGGYSRTRPNARGVYVTGGPFTLRDSCITRCRTGIDMLSAQGTVERIDVSDCGREGVWISLSWHFTLRDVNVTGCQNGFWLNLYSGGRLERCNAHACRATGFNYTAGATTTMWECNASSNPVGVRAYYSSPVLRDCVIYQCDGRGVPVNSTLGMDCLSGSPRVRGGTVIGGYGGIRLNDTRAVVRGVTFTGSDRWCIQVRESRTDVIEGCLFQDVPNATAVFVYMSSPIIRGNRFWRVSYAITGATDSHLVIEDNTIINVTWDGIWLVSNVSAEMRGNLVRDVGYYGVHVMLYSSLVSRKDVIRDIGNNGVFVWKASTVDMRDCSLVNCSVGVYAFDAHHVRVAYCGLRDLNRGVVVYRDLGPNALSTSVEAVLEGCYITNHSSYAVGIFDGNLSVIDCNFLDNIAAIQANNASVQVVDCIMVGSWLFGISAEGTSHVVWRVGGRCRIISSDIIGRVDLLVEGGDLLIEDSIMDLEPGCSFTSTPGSVVTLRATYWDAQGSTILLLGSEVELIDSTFTAVGPALGGEPGRIGVSLVGCDAHVEGCSFRRTRTGLSLVSSDTRVTGSRFTECGIYGIHCRGGTLVLEGTRINRTMVGDAIHLDGSATMWARDSSVTMAVNGVVLVDAFARMDNCSIGGASVASIRVEGSLLELYNTTHQADRVVPGENGTVRVHWYLSARVLWPDPAGLTSVTVWVEDVDGDEVARGQPDGAGLLRDMVILALELVEDGVVPHGPHTVYADLEGYTIDVRVDLTSSRWVVLDLKDDDPPVFELVSPAGQVVLTRSSELEVYGRATDRGAGIEDVRVFIDFGPTSRRAEGGVFAFTLVLDDGNHTIELVATDRAGNTATHTLMASVRSQPLVMTPPEPGDGTLTSATSVVLHGRLSRTEDVTVRINRALATVDREDRSYALEVDLWEGANGFSILAEDIYGHQTWANITIRADWTPPDLLITSPLDINTTDDWVEVTGRVSADAKLYIQGSLVLLREGTFSVRYPVYVGESAVRVRAVDGIGNSREVTVLVFRQEVSVEPEGPNPWEVYIFLIIIPILSVALYVALREREFGGEGP